MTNRARSLLHIRSARVAVGFFILLWSLGMVWMGYAVNNTYFPDFDKGRYFLTSAVVVLFSGGIGSVVSFYRFGSVRAGKVAIVGGLALLVALCLSL